MVKLICAVRDIAADVYSNPFVALNRNTAMRDFSHACRDENSQLFKNPEDFQLYVLGSFEDDTGVIVGVAPELVCNATQFSKGE